MNKSFHSKINNRKGMSFVEAIVAMFVFSVIVVSVIQVFSSSFGGYQKTGSLQKNLENSQYAIDAMAKSLRTSTVFSAFESSIKAFDYSEAKCNQFYLESDGNLWRKSVVYGSGMDEIDKKTDCENNNFGSGTNEPMTSQYGEVKFNVVPTNDGVLIPENKKMGKVTISFRVCSTQGCSGKGNIESTLQTSVSLRDYRNAGL